MSRVFALGTVLTKVSLLLPDFLLNNELTELGFLRFYHLIKITSDCL